MDDFEGKVVIVTGAAGGIGRASAVAFARKGARVVVADLNKAGVNETASMIGENARPDTIYWSTLPPTLDTL
jgi:NAD(P)-dependent dehydrogenase (short-subunit alcohol dehydrogenase family)